MSISRRLSLASAVAAVTALAASAVAATGGVATAYHGTFSGPVVYQGCPSGEPPAQTATGHWNVVLRGEADPVLSVNIFTNGAHHVSFGAPVPQIEPATTTTFALQLETQAGTLTVRRTGSAFTYTISPYSYQGISCEAVVYSGTVS